LMSYMSSFMVRKALWPTGQQLNRAVASLRRRLAAGANYRPRRTLVTDCTKRQ